MRDGQRPSHKNGSHRNFFMIPVYLRIEILAKRPSQSSYIGDKRLIKSFSWYLKLWMYFNILSDLVSIIPCLLQLSFEWHSRFIYLHLSIALYVDRIANIHHSMWIKRFCELFWLPWAKNEWKVLDAMLINFQHEKI